MNFDQVIDIGKKISSFDSQKVKMYLSLQVTKVYHLRLSKLLCYIFHQFPATAALGNFSTVLEISLVIHFHLSSCIFFPF